MKQEINLEEILLKVHFGNADLFTRETVYQAMKCACYEVLDLAAENAYVEYEEVKTGEIFDYTDVMVVDGVRANINKQSILQIKNWIE